MFIILPRSRGRRSSERHFNDAKLSSSFAELKINPATELLEPGQGPLKRFRGGLSKKKKKRKRI